MNKVAKKIFGKVSDVLKDTATTSGLLDRKDVITPSHMRKCQQRAFWRDQVKSVRDIQCTLHNNYNGSKILICFWCCRKEDMKVMIQEAVDDFHALPRQVLESGREVPITVKTDITTIELGQYKSSIPSLQYYEVRDVGQIEQEKRDLKTDIADLMREHSRIYGALQRLADQHRRFRIRNKEPSLKQLKEMIKAACQLENTKEGSSLLDNAFS